ncbi:MAG: hypothetical protein KatS3mg051_2131 [Anaerolineae bacterium]|nr:MAG: hypothetical protein KatS3mg051_2131 [Anaerolineae bacterium]
MPAIRSHSTETSTGAWDGPANEARLRNDGDESYYRRAYAWQDPDANPDTKAAYRFVHHEVDGDGNIGPANVQACRTGIAVLNGARGGTTIPEADRRGVYEHLARHLRDAGQEPPPLKALEATGEMLLAFGDTIKALPGGRIGGYLVRFTGPDMPDLEGDYFDASTDFGVEDGDPVGIYYNHGIDPVLKRRRLGRGTLRFDDVGVWVEAQLAMRDEYERAIYQMVEQGKLGWSSGTLAHLMEREQKGQVRHIKHWPIGEASITPTPAAGPILTRIQPLKTWSEATQHLQALLPEAPEDGAAQRATVQEAQPQVAGQYFSHGGSDMSDETKRQEAQTQAQAASNERKAAPDVVVRHDPREDFQAQMRAVLDGWRLEVVDPLQEKIKSVDELSTKIEQVLQYMQDTPAIRRAGYYTEDGGTADPNVKSFGDFLLAVRRRDHKRLVKMYGSRPDYDEATKDLSTDSGGGGGYLVPTEYSNQLLQVNERTSPVMSRVQRIPVRTTAGQWPALDQYAAPTAGVGDTAFAAGVTASVTAEGGALSETEPGFEMLQWRIHKIGGYTQVTNELIADSPQAIEALLRGLFNVAINAKKEFFVLRGNGVGQPLGILNSSAVVNVAPATNNLFSWQDVATMQSRFFQVGTQAPVWLIHPSVWPDILTMEIGTAGANAWTANMQAAAGNVINGYPIVQSQHLPQADNSGDVILADLFAYVLFEREEISIAFSEHYAFVNDLGTWRFTQRLDGKPWLKSAITLADPQGGYTVSPFVVHND